MSAGYRNIKGLLETIEAQRPSDAIAGEKAKKVGFAVYDRTLTKFNDLQATAGISSRSQVFRAIIDFADQHQQEFAEFLENASELKVG